VATVRSSGVTSAVRVKRTRADLRTTTPYWDELIWLDDVVGTNELPELTLRVYSEHLTHDDVLCGQLLLPLRHSTYLERGGLGDGTPTNFGWLPLTHPNGRPSDGEIRVWIAWLDSTLQPSQVGHHHRT